MTEDILDLTPDLEMLRVPLIVSNLFFMVDFTFTWYKGFSVKTLFFLTRFFKTSKELIILVNKMTMQSRGKYKHKKYLFCLIQPGLIVFSLSQPCVNRMRGNAIDVCCRDPNYQVGIPPLQFIQLIIVDGQRLLQLSSFHKFDLLYSLTQPLGQLLTLEDM